MYKKLILGLCCVAFSVSSQAAKPEWAGSGKAPTDEQKAVHEAAMEAKGKSDHAGNEVEDLKDKAEKAEKKSKKEKELKANQGLAKQKTMKSEQERKELGKGSEKGQEARSESKKWWKFWE